LGRSPLHFLISIFYFLSLQSFRRARAAPHPSRWMESAAG
jgi:hypothetical protein